MEAQRPAMSQYQGPTYIKQLEDVFMPPQPFSMAVFPHQASEFKPLNPKLPAEFVPLQEINPDFFPFKIDYKRYIHNSKAGYHDDTTYPKIPGEFSIPLSRMSSNFLPKYLFNPDDVPYPIYTSGFSNGYR